MIRRRPNTEYHKASDLINSQSGFKDIRKDPEEKVKAALCTWLEPNGCKVYWEKRNSLNKPIFTTENVLGGTCEKPDLLIQRTDVSSNNVYYALEVKDASSNSNVYDSFPQVLRYSAGNLSYSIDENPINISGYFVADIYSLKGCLFSNDVLNDPDSFSDGRHQAIIKGELPENEYILTEQYVRLLWRMAKDIGIEARIGALLSTKLNGAVVPAPMVLYSDIRGNAGIQGIEIWKR